MSNQSTKRPCPSPGGVKESTNEIDKLVEELENNENPSVKDLSTFIVNFFKNTNNLNSRVLTSEYKIAELEDRCDEQDARITTIEDRLAQIEGNQVTQKKETETKLGEITEAIGKVYEKSITNHSHTLVMQQTLMDREIILKGFPKKPDLEDVIQKFITKYEVDLSLIKEYYYVSYVKNPTTSTSSDRPKMDPSVLHFIVIAFKSKITKIRVFQKKKAAKGPLLLRDLVCETSITDKTVIKISNKLSKFNLYVQRVLYKALTHKVVSEFRFHNCLFQTKLSASSNWIRIDSYDKINNINTQIPKTSSNL